MKIYIAGPITNDPHFLNKFKEAEQRLLELGYTPFNPCKHEGFEYKEYIDMGLCELSKCDAIVMLQGSNTSDGATLEMNYAKTVGLPIFRYLNGDIVELFPALNRMNFPMKKQRINENEN